MSERTRQARLGICVALAVLSSGAVSPAGAQWATTYDQRYLPGAWNWTFRNRYAAADRLFNAFDYGHAILYERLYTEPDADVSRLEGREYDFITRTLLVRPPRVPLEESAIEVEYAKMAPEAKAMFDWAHLLHRQIYDVLADERLSREGKDALVRRLVDYYRTRPDLAFSSVPKSMDLMEAQPYSLAFRRKYPKFNGLIWGYHWLQVGLYEPLVVGRTADERQAGVLAAVARFREMLADPLERLPRMMPMTAAVAPEFASRFPEAAIIFDNLHSMHDVVSDILTNPLVPHERKRAEILAAAARYRDRTSYPMTTAEWRDMAGMMGLENMGGPAVGVLAGWPTPTVARGATAAEAMRGMHGGDGMAGMQHDAPATGAVPPADSTPADSTPVTPAPSTTRTAAPAPARKPKPTPRATPKEAPRAKPAMPPMPGMPGMEHGSTHPPAAP